MRVLSKNLIVSSPELQSASRDHSWWDSERKSPATTLTDGQVVMIKALNRYTDWPMTSLTHMFPVKGVWALWTAVRRSEPVLRVERIPDEFYTLTGMEKSPTGPKGKAISCPFSMGNRKIPDSTIALIRELHSRGVKAPQVAKFAGISEHYCRRVVVKDAHPFLTYTKEDLPENMDELVALAKEV